MALGPVKPHVKAAANEITAKFGISNIGGFATSGHITNSDHYKGLALDAMTSNVTKGNAIAAWALARSDVTYVIWNRRIYDRRNGKGWQRYTGSSPHTDHVHISFAGSSSEPVVGGGAAAGSGIDVGAFLGEWFEGIGLQVAMFIGGGALLVLGLYLIYQDVM